MSIFIFENDVIQVYYVLLAVIIHGLIDALIGIVPLYVPDDYVIIVLETAIAITALAVLTYSIWIKRRGLLQ